MKPLVRALGVLLLAGSVLALTTHRAQAANPLLTMTQFASGLTEPIGVDAHYLNGAVDQLIVSVNHKEGGSNGGLNNFAQVPLTGGAGPFLPFGSTTGLPDEISITTVKPGQLGGWTLGDMFVPGNVGQVNKLAANGTLSLFANTGTTDFIRGEMAFDRTGNFNYNLIAASRSGQIVEIASNGSVTPLVNLSTSTQRVEIEGLTVVPANNTLLGPLAGKLVATSPDTGLMYAIDKFGTVVPYNLGIATPRFSNYFPNGINDWESAHVIPAGADFYQVEWVDHQVLTLSAAQLQPFVGQLLLVQESGPAQIWALKWDSTAQAFVPTLLAAPKHPGDNSTGNYNLEQGNFIDTSTPPQNNGPFYTATQGGWGQVPKGNNVGSFLAAHFTQAFGSAGVTIGTGGNTATFDSQLAVQNFLPAKGKFAAPLSGASLDPTSTTTGEFAGQVLSATIAVGFSQAGITQPGLDLLKPVSGPLAGVPISTILIEANKVLAGQSSVYSRGDLNTVLDAFNNNFDGGTVDKGGFH